MIHTKECIKTWQDYHKAWRAYKINKDDMVAKQAYFDAGDTYNLACLACGNK